LSTEFIEERCAPRKVGFASAVDNLVAKARAAEVENFRKEAAKVSDPGEAESHEELLDWLEDLGVSRGGAEISLKRHETIVKLQLLHDLAKKYRALWAPQPCPWVGALDDEAKLIAKQLSA
jgi:hypothetical protein